jgi:hypothetical protein
MIKEEGGRLLLFLYTQEERGKIIIIFKYTYEHAYIFSNIHMYIHIARANTLERNKCRI